MGVSIFRVFNAQGQPLKDLGKGGESAPVASGFTETMNGCMESDGATAPEPGRGVDNRTDGPNGDSQAHGRFHDNMDMSKKPCEGLDGPRGGDPEAPPQDAKPLEGAITVKNEDGRSSPAVSPSDGKLVAALDAKAADKSGMDNAYGNSQIAPLPDPVPEAGTGASAGGRRSARSGAALSDAKPTSDKGEADKADNGPQAAPLTNPVPPAGLSGFVQDMRTAQDGAPASDAAGPDGGAAAKGKGGIDSPYKHARGASAVVQTAADSAEAVAETASGHTEPGRTAPASKGPAGADLATGAANGVVAPIDSKSVVAAAGAVAAAATNASEVVREPAGKEDKDGRDIEAGDGGQKDSQAVKGGLHRLERRDGVAGISGDPRQAPVAAARTGIDKAAGAPTVSVALNGSAGQEGSGTGAGKGLEGGVNEKARPGNDAAPSVAAAFSADRGVDKTMPNVSREAPRPPQSPAADSGVFDRIDSGVKIAVTKGAREVSISLHPEHLGAIHIKLNMEDRSSNTVSARITVDSPEVKGLLDSDASALKDAFSRQGLKLDNYTIEVGKNAFGADNGNGRYPGGSGAWAGGGGAGAGGYRDGASYRGASGRLAGTEDMKDASYSGSTPVRAWQGVGGPNTVDLFA